MDIKIDYKWGEEFIIHEQCQMPLDLCVCMNGDCIQALTSVQCLSCTAKSTIAHPPGMPITDFACYECQEVGVCVRL